MILMRIMTHTTDSPWLFLCISVYAYLIVHNCVCIYLFELVLFASWFSSPLPKINHPDVSLFFCWLFLTLYIKQKHLSQSLRSHEAMWFLLIVVQRVEAGRREEIFHLQLDFKQTYLITLQSIGPDLSFLKKKYTYKVSYNGA